MRGPARRRCWCLNTPHDPGRLSVLRRSIPPLPPIPFLPKVKADLALLKEANVNYVRGAHYPQDQRFLDLCDENGIAIWEETLGPGTSTTDFESDYFMQYQLQVRLGHAQAAILSIVSPLSSAPT